MPPYRCLWETTCLVYYENSFHICLSLVVGREFKQTKWQTLYFEAGEVAQWLKVLVAELSDLGWRPRSIPWKRGLTPESYPSACVCMRAQRRNEVVFGLFLVRHFPSLHPGCSWVPWRLLTVPVGIGLHSVSVGTDVALGSSGSLSTARPAFVQLVCICSEL